MADESKWWHLKPQTLAPEIHLFCFVCEQTITHTKVSRYKDTHVKVESPTLLPQTYSNTHNNGLFCLIPRRLVYFGLWVCMYTHACLWHTEILMWFHLHARDPFVFIIIIRLEEADLLGLVATAMPLCLGIKNNFTTWTFVMSPHHRIRDIKREIVPRTSIKLHFRYYPKRGLKFWLMVVLTQLLWGDCVYWSPFC